MNLTEKFSKELQIVLNKLCIPKVFISIIDDYAKVVPYEYVETIYSSFSNLKIIDDMIYACGKSNGGHRHVHHKVYPRDNKLEVKIKLPKDVLCIKCIVSLKNNIRCFSTKRHTHNKFVFNICAPLGFINSYAYCDNKLYVKTINDEIYLYDKKSKKKQYIMYVPYGSLFVTKKYIIVPGITNYIHIYDRSTKTLVSSILNNEFLNKLICHITNEYVYACTSRYIKIYNLRNIDEHHCHEINLHYDDIFFGDNIFCTLQKQKGKNKIEIYRFLY